MTTKTLSWDIFLSYTREDESRVRPLVSALTAQGWSVFWDRTIPPGKTWDEYIGRALDGSRCVIVAWSERSINSKWVREEAHQGAERELLMPVLLDRVKQPLGFRQIQAADLSLWSGESEHHDLKSLVQSVRDLLAPVPQATAGVSTAGSGTVTQGAISSLDTPPDAQTADAVPLAAEAERQSRPAMLEARPVTIDGWIRALLWAQVCGSWLVSVGGILQLLGAIVYPDPFLISSLWLVLISSVWLALQSWRRRFKRGVVQGSIALIGFFTVVGVIPLVGFPMLVPGLAFGIIVSISAFFVARRQDYSSGPKAA